MPEFDNILKQASKYLCGIPEDLNKAIDISMCSYEGYFPNIDCVLHKCSDCSIDSLKQKLLDCNKLKLTNQCKCYLVKDGSHKQNKMIGQLNHSFSGKCIIVHLQI